MNFAFLYNLLCVLLLKIFMIIFKISCCCSFWDCESIFRSLHSICVSIICFVIACYTRTYSVPFFYHNKWSSRSHIIAVMQINHFNVNKYNIFVCVALEMENILWYWCHNKLKKTMARNYTIYEINSTILQQVNWRSPIVSIVMIRNALLWRFIYSAPVKRT